MVTEPTPPPPKTSPSSSKSSKSSLTPTRRSSRIKTSSSTPIDGPGAKSTEPIIVNEEDSEATISDLIASVERSSIPKRESSPPPEPSSKKPRKDPNKGKEKVVEESKNDDQNPERDELPREIQPSQVSDQEKWLKRGILIGRTYLFDELKMYGWDFCPYIARQGWLKVLSEEEIIYPNLVREFYGIMGINEDRTCFTTQVKGTMMVITPRMLSNAFGIPLSGVSIYGEDWYERANLTKENALAELMKDPRANLISSSLKDHTRVMHNKVVHSLLPRAGSFERIKSSDLLLVYHMYKRYVINLPYVIFHYMVDIVKTLIQTTSLPYGMFLTKVFRMNKISFENEECIKDKTVFWSKSVKQMGIKLSDTKPTPKTKTRAKATKHSQKKPVTKTTTNEQIAKEDGKEEATPQGEQLNNEEALDAQPLNVQFPAKYKFPQPAQPSQDPIMETEPAQSWMEVFEHEETPDEQPPDVCEDEIVEKQPFGKMVDDLNEQPSDQLDENEPSREGKPTEEVVVAEKEPSHAEEVKDLLMTSLPMKRYPLMEIYPLLNSLRKTM